MAYEYSDADWRELVENLKPDQSVDQHADSYEDNAESGNDQDRVEVAPKAIAHPSWATPPASAYGRAPLAVVAAHPQQAAVDVVLVEVRNHYMPG